MATSFPTSATTKLTSGRDEVYVGAVPLRATKGPAQLVMSTAYSLNLWDVQHFMVLIKSNNSSQQNPQAIVFYFQPKDPENIQTALAVLSGGTVPGSTTNNVTLVIFPQSIDAMIFKLRRSWPEKKIICYVLGVVQIRKLKKLPRRKCWFVGSSKVDDAVGVASKFSDSWETDLKIGHHDCRDYTNGLIELLTGKKLVLESLRRSNSLRQN